MSAVTELKSDIRELEAQHDALERALTRKHAEYDKLLLALQAKTDALDKIKREIARLKSHFGVS